MSENKRFYWLKLHEDFFHSKRIKKLRSIAGGDTYLIIYLKMQLLAINSEGVLFYDGIESDFATEIALDLDEEVDDVRVTLDYLIRTGLCTTEDGTSYRFPYVLYNTGSETASTLRSRESRERSKLLQCNNLATLTQRLCNNVQQSCNGEIDIDTDTDIDTDIDTEREGREAATHLYGSYGNVLLSEAEVDRLHKQYPRDYLEKIERLSSYIASSGKRYQSCYETIIRWASMDSRRNEAGSGK